MDASGNSIDADANKLRAKADIDVDGVTTTTLDAKAVNTDGAATANTTTQLQKGLIVSNNDSSGNPSVIDGASVDLNGTVTSTAIANASTNGGGSATANAIAFRPESDQTFGGEKIGADLDRINSKGTAIVKGLVNSSFDVDATNTTGSATAKTTELQVTGVLGTELFVNGIIDVGGTATVDQNAKAVTKSGGNATATVVSGPDFGFGSLAEGQLPLDGITGIAYTRNIDGKSNVNLDGIVTYTGSADADNTTGNASATVGKANLPIQAMVGVLTVTPNNVNSDGDMAITGNATANTTASATTFSGSATAEVNSDPIKGIKSNPGVEYQSGGDLILDGLAQIGAQSTATATGGTGKESNAGSIISNVVGIDMSDLNSVPNSETLEAEAKGDINIKGFATANLNSDATITTGSANADSTSALTVGLIADKIKSGGDGRIIGNAFNTSNASATTIGIQGTGNSATSLVDNGETVGINLGTKISISGAGSIEGIGIASGSSKALGTTAATTARAASQAKGIILENGSDIEIKGSSESLGDITAQGFIGTLRSDETGTILSPFNIEATTTTGNSAVDADFTALGIISTEDSMTNGSIKTINSNISGTGAAIIDAKSTTTNGASRATSMTDIFGIKAANLEIGGSGNTIAGYAYGNINTEALNTNGDANATSTINNGIGIDGGSSGINANVIGEIIGIADITQTVMAKTVSGNATATATSGPVIGIKNTSIFSAGDLTITANASLDSTAYAEVGSM